MRLHVRSVIQVSVLLSQAVVLLRSRRAPLA
jgi:hypothetical protein